MAAYRIDWRIELRANRLAGAQRLLDRLRRGVPAVAQLRRICPSDEGRGLWDAWLTTSLTETTFAEAVVASMHLSAAIADGWAYRIAAPDEEQFTGTLLLRDGVTHAWLSGLRWASFGLVHANAPAVAPPLVRDDAVPEQMGYTVWIEAEALGFHRPGDPTDAESDVIVHFAGHRKWQAWFVTVKRLETLRQQYRQNGECLAGRYLWAPAMIFVDEISREAIEAVIRDLLASGRFECAFAWVGECDEMEGADQADSDD